MLILSLVYFILGSGVKYIDAAYDDSTFNKKYNFAFGLLLGTIAGVAMIADKATLLIFLSVIAAVLITGKLDNPPFRVLAFIAVAIPLCFYKLSLPFTAQDWKIVCSVLCAGAIDELGNDWADRSKARNIPSLFFLYRGLLKLVILAFACVNFIRFDTAVNFLLFDSGYLLISLISERRAAIRIRTVNG